MVHYYILAIFLIIAFYLDARFSKLPNWLTISGVVVGLGIHLTTDGLAGLVFSLLGLVCRTVVLLLLYIFKALGAGDVKLFAAIGALTGMQFALYGIMYSVLFAGLIGVILLIYKQPWMRRAIEAVINWGRKLASRESVELKSKEIVQFPFMYAVMPGILVSAYYFF